MSVRQDSKYIYIPLERPISAAMQYSDGRIWNVQYSSAGQMGAEFSRLKVDRIGSLQQSTTPFYVVSRSTSKIPGPFMHNRCTPSSRREEREEGRGKRGKKDGQRLAGYGRRAADGRCCSCVVKQM